MLTRKYYIMIARVINNCTIKGDVKITNKHRTYTTECIDKDNLINTLSIMFNDDNSLFSRDKFIEACND